MNQPINSINFSMKRIVAYSISLLLGVAVYLFWAIPFRGALNYHEEFQFFLNDTDYFLAHLSQAGGLSVYISEFLVQFYNNYWIGALILAVEFMLIQWLTLKVLQGLFHAWSQKHNYLLCVLSLIPALLLWLVLGDINVMHSLIIAVIVALALAFIIVSLFKNKIYRIVGAIVSVIIYICVAGTSHYRLPGMSLMVDNIYNEKTYELLDYDLLVRTNQWNKIISKAKSKQPDLPQSVCATNLALGMTNQLGSRANQFFQNGPEGLFPTFTKDPFSTLTTAEVFFQLGLVNTAQRYYFEAMEASPICTKSSRCIRRLAETNLINGQYGVARKYLHLLEKTLFYKKWAQRMLAMIDNGEDAINAHPLYGRLRSMRIADDFLFSDREVDKICGRLLMQNPDNVLAMQYMLLYPLLENNYEKFVQYMHLVKDNVPYSQEFASFERYLRQQ